jgi:hypothetical protein
MAAVVVPIDRSTTTVAPQPEFAALQSGAIPAEFGQGLTHDPGTLTVTGADPVHGDLVSQLTLPKKGAAICTGSLNGRFSWDQTNPSAHQLTLSSSFVSASPGPDGATVYSLAGYANVVGGIGAFQGYAAVSGTITVPASGSTGTADLQFSADNGSTPTVTCPTDASTSTSTSTTAPPSSGSSKGPAGP